MAEEWPLLIEFDVPEPRIEVGRFVASADGTSSDLPVCDNTIYIDPATNTAMLAPLCFRPNWRTTFTGDYTRFRKSDYTFAEPAAWVENQPRGAGDWFIESLGINDPAYLTAATATNQPMFVSAYIHEPSSTDGYFILECGWNRGAANELTIRLMVNGDIEIVKNSAVVGRFNRKEPSYKNNHGAASNASIGQKFVSFALIPCRRRELLIVTDWGQSFSHAFDDLDVTLPTESNVIIPPGNFYWYVPFGKASVQVAPIKFETSGSIYGAPVEFRTPPPTGTTFAAKRSNDRVGLGSASISAAYSLVKEDLSAYTPDGVIDTARVKIALTGDGNGSEGIYAVDCYSDPTTYSTADAAVDVTCAIGDLSLSVDERGRTTCRLSARRKNLVDAGVDRPHLTNGRTIRIALGATGDEVDIFRGTLKAPQITYLANDKTADHDWSELQYEGQDRSAITEAMELRTYPYDGLDLHDAILDLHTLTGFAGDPYQIDDPAFELPYSPAVSTGEWALLPERGDSPGQWIEKIRSDFSASYITGWVPTLSGYAWRYVDPYALSATPVLTLYQSTQDAIDAGVSATLAHSRVVRGLAEHYEPPEANQITVVGQDPKTRLLITATYNDDASQDASLDPADRPENWVGHVLTITHPDPTLMTSDAVGRAGLTLAQTTMPGRNLIEFDSDVLVDDATDRPLWISDAVKIMEPDGTTEKGTYRIIAIPRMDFDLEAPSRAVWREARYVGWLIREQSLDFSDPLNSIWI